jgi:hypothetical protein
MNPMVSDSVRRANSRAVARRNVWRRQYAQVVKSIRSLKSQLVKSGYDPVVHLQLRTMRIVASEMMYERNHYIRFDLVNTSYPYADRTPAMAAE